MKWITRERAKVDRIACPWLISRFLDPAPEFIYVPADQVLAEMAAARSLGARVFRTCSVSRACRWRRRRQQAFR